MTAGFLREVVRANAEAARGPRYLAGVPAERAASPPSLCRAVERESHRGALLVEFKRVSPGQVEPRLPVREAREFVRGVSVPGVAGFSCLATVPHFDGSPGDVAELVRATDRPVLFKDFVVDVPQLDVAARCGASAVLLIARLAREGLLDRPLSVLAREAHDRGLEVLLEFHRKAELAEALGVDADMYGVNVRDLDSLVIDRPTAGATLAAADEEGLRPLLGLSGVATPEDAARFWDAGVDGILLGTAVARAPDPARFLATLGRPMTRGPT